MPPDVLADQVWADAAGFQRQAAGPALPSQGVAEEHRRWLAAGARWRQAWAAGRPRGCLPGTECKPHLDSSTAVANERAGVGEAERYYLAGFSWRPHRAGAGDSLNNERSLAKQTGRAGGRNDAPWNTNKCSEGKNTWSSGVWQLAASFWKLEFNRSYCRSVAAF